MQVEAELFCDTKQPVLGVSAGSPNAGESFVGAFLLNKLSEFKGFQFFCFFFLKSLFGCATFIFLARYELQSNA